MPQQKTIDATLLKLQPPPPDGMAVDGGGPAKAAAVGAEVQIEMYPLTPEEENNKLKREAMENTILMWRNTPFLPGETAHHPSTLAAIKGLEVDLAKIPKAPHQKLRLSRTRL